MYPDDQIQLLSETLVKEIVNAAGLPVTRGWRNLARFFFRRATERLAGIGLGFDRDIAALGAPSAAGRVLDNWCREVQASGAALIPPKGPLLVVSNHAGTYDSFVICSTLGRVDLKVISSDIPFFKHLPNLARHVIFLSENIQDRMTATRAGIRHLKAGGAMLIYGTGLIDPDPAVYPDASVHIGRWSPSIDLFLRTVPDLKLALSIVSGVVSPKWARHPVTWLRRIDWQKRRIAEFGQVLQQLFIPGSLFLEPCISFSPPVPASELRAASGGGTMLPAVIARGQSLLEQHVDRFLPH